MIIICLCRWSLPDIKDSLEKAEFQFVHFWIRWMPKAGTMEILRNSLLVVSSMKNHHHSRSKMHGTHIFLVWKTSSLHVWFWQSHLRNYMTLTSHLDLILSTLDFAWNSIFTVIFVNSDPQFCVKDDAGHFFWKALITLENAWWPWNQLHPQVDFLLEKIKKVYAGKKNANAMICLFLGFTKIDLDSTNIN